MPSHGTTKMAASIASAAFAIFLATAVIRFGGWMQSHSSAVDSIMYASLLLVAVCLLFWFIAQSQTETASDSDRQQPEPGIKGSADASSGNIHFAPVIQVGNIGSLSVPTGPPVDVASDLEDAAGHGLPTLELTFAQGSASLEGSTLCYSEAGSHCVSIRVYSKPAAEMGGAMVARKIVASISLKLGSRGASVESSCWIGRDASQIDLHPGAYADALLAFPDRDALTMYENQNPIPAKDLEWNSPFPEPERVPFPLGGMPATVTGEIHVISRANHLKHTTLAHRRFIISIDDRGSGLPGINVRWADSSASASSGDPSPTPRALLSPRASAF
jgi:hypothetical protein